MNVKNLFMYVFFMVLILPMFVSAFSISPPIFVYEYDELTGFSDEFNINIRSGSPELIFLEVTFYGAIADYMVVSTDTLELRPNEIKSVNVKIDVPPGLDLVGPQEARVEFKKVPKDSEGMMVITTSLRARIIVNFAYPGEYVVINSLGPVNVNKGENTVVNWELQAKGTETTSFISEITIFDSEENLVFSEILPKKFFERNDKYQGSVDVNSENYIAGDYDVFLKVTSKDNVAERNEKLRIGTEDVRLSSFSPENFTVGKIVEFSFEVENLWNGDFKNVYGSLSVEGVSVTTKSVSLKPFGKAIIDKQYIDLSSLPEGSYNGTLTIFFEDYSKVFNVTLNAVPEPVVKSRSSTLIIILVIVLLIIGLLIFFLFKRTNLGLKND